ncbi:MAG: bifunctional phosphoribosyl-AMP cyclohydrolase/phosphoribosyl-ATP diphosphatase HisIE [Bacteroidetes bacterium]|nr:MAG: bifunctional phosphoribosyl-AMP cyclohydrolase/phosphoribosyl-ATP diphosphatase HisIE [Bacteroidota bacterium]
MNLNFNKGDGLIPVIIQNYTTSKVLMLGYMNAEAYQKTVEEGIVTFYSRSKNRLWTKGETSGNRLTVVSMAEDCDSDCLLISVTPSGPTCHLGTESCFADRSAKGYIYQLEKTITQRIDQCEKDSYTYSLFERGINKVAQKVGEEAVEVVIEAKDNNDELFLNEVADLTYHLIVLLKAKGFTLGDIETVLRARSK